MNHQNKVDKLFIKHVVIWSFLALQTGIGFITSLYWMIWLAKDLAIID